MTWRDDLLPTSFRGVEFHYADISGEGGRRLSVSEFPLRDDPYVEDLGRAVRGFTVSGYVLGRDYGTDRDALISALEAKDPGTFQHPFKGPLLVAVRRFHYRETKEEGGYCVFDIEFVEAGKAPSPTTLVSTADKVASSAKSTMSWLQTAFAGAYVIAGYPARLAAEAQGLVGQLTDALVPVTSAVAALQSDAQMFLSGVEEIKLVVLEPVLLASSVVSFFQRFADDVADFIPAFDETTSSRGPAIPADLSYGLAALAVWGTDIPAVIGTIPVRLQQQANQDALIALVQGSAVCALSQVYASTDFTGLEEAGAARDQIVGFLDDLAFKAADRGDNDVYRALNDLAQTVTQDLTVRGKQLPDVLSVNFGAALPAIVIAQRLYQDASRAGELVAKNRAPHPLFFPLTVEALSS
jgi:prophage DNA circulation protein